MTGRVTVLRGDAACLPLPDSSVDAVVTDPPYNLSDSSKRDTQCLRRVVAEFCLPDDRERDAQGSQRSDLPGPALSGAPLGRVDRAVRVDARIGVPEGAVDLQRAAVAELEVNAGSEPAVLTPDSDLPLVEDAEAVEGGGGYVLKLADGGHAPFCDVTCSCFTEPGEGLIAVTVALPGAARGDLAGDDLGRARWRDEDVRIGDHAGREPEGTAGVLAGGRAEARAVLRLDLRRGTGELRLADRAGERESLFTLEAAQPVGAGAGTGRLAAVPESARIRVVGGAADRAFALYLPLHVTNSSARTGGFMGKAWDGFESPAAFQRWCTAWAAECLRVLKPGGHLLAFGGTRTWHRLTCAIEDAGFEIRESVADLTGIDGPGLLWVQGSGFPKSKNLDGDHKGWGTALKPAWEPIVVGRKPLAGTVAVNVAEHGTGALNIDGCRLAFAGSADLAATERKNAHADFGSGARENQILGDMGQHSRAEEGNYDGSAGRWPPNVLLGEDAATELDRQSGVSVSIGGSRGAGGRHGAYSPIGAQPDVKPGFGDVGGASRFFPVFRYEAKADAYERPRLPDGTQWPTVKPVPLMQWLVRLVTPPGGKVLDLFCGTGTTGEACTIEGFDCILLDRDPQALALTRVRLAKPVQPSLFGDAS